MAGKAAVVIGLVVALGGPAMAGELERLRAENARLQQRVRDLEAENSTLRGENARERQGLAAALQSRATEAVVVTPSEGTGTSHIETEKSLLEGVGNKGRHWIIWRADQAAGGGRPAAVNLVVDTAASGGQYRNLQTVRLVVDGAPMELAVIETRVQINSVGRDTANRTQGEAVTARVPIDELDRLTAAREVQGTMGTTSFRLTPQQIADVQAFAKRLGS